MPWAPPSPSSPCFNLFAPLQQRFPHGAGPRTLPSTRGCRHRTGLWGRTLSPAPRRPLRSTTGKRGVWPLGLQRLANFLKNREKVTQFCLLASRADQKPPLPWRKGWGSGSAGLAPPCSCQGHGDALPPHVLGLDPSEMGLNWGHCGGQGWVPPPGMRPPSGDGGHDTREHPTVLEKHWFHGKGFGHLQMYGPARGWVLHGWGFGAGMGTQGRTPGPGGQGYLLAQWKASRAPSARS